MLCAVAPFELSAVERQKSVIAQIFDLRSDYIRGLPEKKRFWWWKNVAKKGRKWKKICIFSELRDRLSKASFPRLRAAHWESFMSPSIYFALYYLLNFISRKHFDLVSFSKPVMVFCASIPVGLEQLHITSRALCRCGISIPSAHSRCWLKNWCWS